VSQELKFSSSESYSRSESGQSNRIVPDLLPYWDRCFAAFFRVALDMPFSDHHYTYADVPLDYDAHHAVADIMLQMNEAGKTGRYDKGDLHSSGLWAALSEIAVRVDEIHRTTCEERPRVTPFPRKWVDPVRT
jgi:hypothetical protein